ncbi:hypothetical protein BHE97_01335 [Aeromicrobium sp. PE09-221]|uniref:endo alpha-1,4 polygalactosaminidase n=1 Tax=Aeromicrobium sp. PE09-221 TaxID=1898043 RepID=UPI000B3EB60F|nr:endo alpha-1,4 polygalactosaminidase [Aeromicrobium sp. PE09-221]OUZ12393.1 hypothetical protein BHE97_01335 [Aeromicrobium sp. PE09-221]
MTRLQWYTLTIAAFALVACGGEEQGVGALRGGVVDYQLGGAYEPDDEVTIVVRDRTDEPDPSRYSICYVNAFQTQPDERDTIAREHPQLLLTGPDGPVTDPDWPDEQLFDLSTSELRNEVLGIVEPWIAGCAEDGFAAVEADNLDAWTRSQGLYTREDAEAFSERLTELAHEHGLAIGQKNAAEVDGPSLGFDFAVTEECAVFDECRTFSDLYGERVIEIEYTDNGREAFVEACRDRYDEHPITLCDRDLVRAGEKGHVFETC